MGTVVKKGTNQQKIRPGNRIHDQKVSSSLDICFVAITQLESMTRAG